MPGTQPCFSRCCSNATVAPTASFARHATSARWRRDALDEALGATTTVSVAQSDGASTTSSGELATEVTVNERSTRRSPGTSWYEHAIARARGSHHFYPSDQETLAKLPATLAAALATWAPLFASIGAEPMAIPDDAQALPAAWDAALQAAAAVNRWPAESTNHDAETEAAIKAAVAPVGFTIVKIGLVASTPDLDESGNRKRSGHVLAKAKGETYCRIYLVTATSPYIAAGKFGKAAAFFDRVQFEATVSACK